MFQACFIARRCLRPIHANRSDCRAMKVRLGVDYCAASDSPVLANANVCGNTATAAREGPPTSKAAQGSWHPDGRTRQVARRRLWCRRPDIAGRISNGSQRWRSPKGLPPRSVRPMPSVLALAASLTTLRLHQGCRSYEVKIGRASRSMRAINQHCRSQSPTTV